MNVRITETGARDVALSLERMPDDVRDRLASRIRGFTARLEPMVAERVPSRTGRARSQVGSVVDVMPDLVRGRVYVQGPGAENAKLGALEYGARRRHVVREHKRMLDHLWGRAILPMQVIVDRYMRTPNIAEHRFLRGPFEQMRPEILAGLREAADEGVAAAGR
jgi:hypothetical protein